MGFSVLSFPVLFLLEFITEVNISLNSQVFHCSRVTDICGHTHDCFHVSAGF